MQDKITQLLAEIQAGSYKALARGITMVENDLYGYIPLLQKLQNTDTAKVVGITGPPGAGKSTLVNALLHHWIATGKKIAVIAVDPSSPFNYGALLGDRIRMVDFYNHPSVYIRSLATRGALGGLHAKIIEITDVVKHAPFDYILVETVGVGQSEVEIAGLADCTIVALVPEAGDEVQTLKAGIMEIANIFVVNKADRDNADTLYRTLRILAHERSMHQEETPVIKTIATENNGVAELAAAIENYLTIYNSVPQKKLQLLTERCWQIIQHRRMAGYSKAKLLLRLQEAVLSPSFNLYSFADSVVENNG